MPHAASGRLQLQCRVIEETETVCFNAARGKWSVATSYK